MFRVITISMIVLFFFGFFLLVFTLALLWILVPMLCGLPSIPTKPERIRKALKMANLQPNETLYDLGAGDGRVLLLAAGDFGANAVGIEVGPVQCAFIWLRALASGFSTKIRVQWGNYLNVDLHDADVVFLYATSQEVLNVASHLEKQLKPGTRVISISADFHEWEPSNFDEHDLIFVYEMPPKGGSLATYLLHKTT
jgi:SAM-dependent methyltransferase